MCCLLIGCVGMFAACGANDNNTGNTQNNVTDTMDRNNNGTNTNNGTNNNGTNNNGTTNNGGNGNGGNGPDDCTII